MSCSEDNDDNQQQTPSEPNLVIKLKFDPNQIRLDNQGQPAMIPLGNAAQSPSINQMSANYIELAPTAITPLETGEIIYVGDETTAGRRYGTSWINSDGV